MAETALNGFPCVCVFVSSSKLVLWNSLEISSLRDRYSDSCTPELLQLVGRDKKPVLHIRTDVEGDESDG